MKAMIGEERLYYQGRKNVSDSRFLFGGEGGGAIV
jgi:hypothetical protein